MPALEPPPASRFGTRIRRGAVEAPQQPGNVTATNDGLVGVIGVRGLALEVYDAETLESAGRVDAGEGPTHVVSGPDGRFYVADTRGGAILVYEARPQPGRVASAPLPEGYPYGLAVDPEREQLWVTLTAENALVRFDVSGAGPREVERYPTVRQPNTVAVNPETGRVFVADRAGGVANTRPRVIEIPDGKKNRLRKVPFSSIPGYDCRRGHKRCESSRRGKGSCGGLRVTLVALLSRGRKGLSKQTPTANATETNGPAAD